MNLTEVTQEAPPQHGNLEWTGCGSYVAHVLLHFAIFVPRNGRSRLFMRHGCPARADWWRSCKPLRVDADLDALREIIDELCGVTGAHRAFPLIVEN